MAGFKSSPACAEETSSGSSHQTQGCQGMKPEIENRRARFLFKLTKLKFLSADAPISSAADFRMDFSFELLFLNLNL